MKFFFSSLPYLTYKLTYNEYNNIFLLKIKREYNTIFNKD